MFTHLPENCYSLIATKLLFVWLPESKDNSFYSGHPSDMLGSNSCLTFRSVLIISVFYGYDELNVRDCRFDELKQLSDMIKLIKIQVQ